MPTSSQALILQTTPGELPPLFQRKTWRPEVSFRHLPFTPSLNRRVGFLTATARKHFPEIFPLRRTGSEPILVRKIDFSTLHQLLQIRRLGISSSFNTKTDFLTVNMHQRLAPIRYNNYTDGRVKNENIAVRQHVVSRSHTLEHGNNRSMKKKAEHKSRVFMRSKTDGNKMTLEKADVSHADYFRLVEIEENYDEQRKPNKKMFQLIPATSGAPGSFQISPVHSDDFIRFRLFPQGECDADNFRLQATSDLPNTFQLLQRDPDQTDIFKPVEEIWSDGETLQLSDRRLQHQDLTLQPDDYGNDLKRVKTYKNSTKDSDHNRQFDKSRVAANIMYRSAENLAGNFDDVLQVVEDESSTNKESEDINWQSYIKKSALHHPDDLINSSEKQMLSKEEQSLNTKSSQDVMGSIRNQSIDMYERLVNLGFRRTNEDPDKEAFYENIRLRAEKAERQKYYSVDWKTQNYDRSRATHNFNMSDDIFASLENPGMLLTQLLSDQSSPGAKPMSNHGMAWKKKKIKSLRMRKEIPPKDPTAVCICLRDNAISHGELKSKLERETGVKVISLQFDPVSVHCSEPDVKSQWIVRFPNKVICEYLTKCGISIDGVHYCVRSFDDVMRKENNAYRLYLAISDMKNDRKNSDQRSKGAKKINSSETSSGNLPLLTS